MARFLIASVGSHGDVFPFLALGSALRRAGADVLVAANESYQQNVESLDLEFAPLATQQEIDQLLSDPHVWHPTRSALVGARWSRQTLVRQFKILDTLLDRQTILVAPPPLIAARVLQEARGAPLVTIYYMPWMLTSKIEPPAMTSGYTLPAGLPSWIGDLYWLSVDAVAWMLMGSGLNRLRRQENLPPVRRMFSWWTSPDLALALFPDWYAPPPADWPQHLQLTDFPLYQGPPSADECDVLRFCQESEPPVLFTFGTEMRFAGPLLETAAEACALAGRRGLLLTRKRDQLPSTLPTGVAAFQYARLNEVLPHCQGVVHHGGIGTVAAGLRSGTPQLVIPFAWDQLDNARRIERLNAGVHLRRRHANARRLADSIESLAELQTTCKQLADKSREDGMQRAASLLLDFASNRTPND